MWQRAREMVQRLKHFPCRQQAWGPELRSPEPISKLWVRPRDPASMNKGKNKEDLGSTSWLHMNAYTHKHIHGYITRIAEPVEFTETPVALGTRRICVWPLKCSELPVRLYPPLRKGI